MVYGGLIKLDAQVGAPSFHLIGCKVRAIVSNNTMWDTVTVHNPLYEVYHWSGFGHFNWFGFYPFGELVHHDQ